MSEQTTETETTEERFINNEEAQEMSLQELLTSMSIEQKDYLLSIFFLLQQSERFNIFVEDNYQIDRVEDHENKVIDIRIEEKEAAPYYKLTEGKLIRIHEKLCAAGLKKGSKAVAEIITILKTDEVEEGPVIIMPGNTEDMQTEVRDQDILSTVLSDIKVD